MADCKSKQKGKFVYKYIKLASLLTNVYPNKCSSIQEPFTCLKWILLMTLFLFRPTRV